MKAKSTAAASMLRLRAMTSKLCSPTMRRGAEAQTAKDTIARQLADLEKQIESLLDRKVDASSPSVITACEGRIGKLERERLLLRERAAKILPSKGRFEEFIELSLDFPATPWNIYENGGHAA